MVTFAVASPAGVLCPRGDQLSCSQLPPVAHSSLPGVQVSILPSTSACPLVSPLPRSCLGSHADETSWVKLLWHFLETKISQQTSDSSSSLWSFHPFFCYGPWAFNAGVGWLDVSVGAAHHMITWTQHLNWLWFSVIGSICCRETFHYFLLMKSETYTYPWV